MRGRFAGTPAKPRNCNGWLLTFEIDEEPNIYDELKDKELSIEIKQFRQKRSLDSNAYCWVLCTKLAEVLNTSKDEVYEEMIQKYSTFDSDEDGYITVTMKKHIPVEKLGGHWRFMRDYGDFNTYIKLKGSSEMDTKEMSTFIDGIISECKPLGIETLPPDEIERMKSAWGHQS